MAILCMDANFRLKNNLVSNYSQDPGLSTGWAYMIPRKPYEKYVLNRANDEDVSFLFSILVSPVLISSGRLNPALDFRPSYRPTPRTRRVCVTRVPEAPSVGAPR